MRIQVFSNVEDDVTVLETVYFPICQLYNPGWMKWEKGEKRHTSIFPFAHSKLDTTPSITSLMLRTLSNSFWREASRAASASYLDSPVLRCRGALVSVGLEDFWDLETLEGDAKRSSGSEESERSSCPTSGVDILGIED
jgi:hypothetical protein